MSKNCKFCGAEMADDALQCPECEKFVAGANAQLSKRNETRKKRKKTLITAGIITAVAACSVGVIAAASASMSSRQAAEKYVTDPIDLYIEGLQKKNYNKVLAAFPDFYSQEIYDYWSYLSSDDTPEYYFSAWYDDIVADYGTSFDITYEIEGVSVLEDDSLDSTKDELVTLYGMSEESELSEYEVLNIIFTVEGRGNESEFTESLTVAKIDGEWYMMNLVYFINQKTEGGGTDDLTSAE